VLVTAASIAVLVYFLAPYHHAIGRALGRTSIGTLAGLTGLSLLALIVRTEIWATSLAAAGRHPPRSHLHAANSGTFLVSLINHYLAPFAKLWLLRRMEGEGATALVQLVAVELAGTILEVLVAAALVIFAAFQLALAWWVPVLMIGGAGAFLVLATQARARFPDHPAVVGLNVLMRPGSRGRVVVLLLFVFAVQILRTWLSLRAVGLHLGITDGILIFVVTGVLGALPSGLTAAPTAASLIVVSSHGVGAAAGAGVLVTVALFVATLLYCVAGAGFYWRAVRSRPTSGREELERVEPAVTP
jgi:hypothetical protein